MQDVRLSRASLSGCSRTLVLLVAGLWGLLVAGETIAQETFGAQRCIVIDKGQRTLTLYRAGEAVCWFPISVGIDPFSDKIRRGDGATPEGCYFVTHKKPESRFHLFVAISYPNEVDAWQAWRRGLISENECLSISEAASRRAAPSNGTSLGSGIGIHGGGVYRNERDLPMSDWTEGCVALDDIAMAAVFSFCDVGDPVVIYNSDQEFFHMIRPFARLANHKAMGRLACPEGVCTSEAWLDTCLGAMLLRLREGKDYSRSLEIEIYPPGERGLDGPSVVFCDANADGRAGVGDGFRRGSWDGEEDPAAFYQRLQGAIGQALATGSLVPAATLPGAMARLSQALESE